MTIDQADKLFQHFFVELQKLFVSGVYALKIIFSHFLEYLTNPLKFRTGCRFFPCLMPLKKIKCHCETNKTHKSLAK